MLTGNFGPRDNNISFHCRWDGENICMQDRTGAAYYWKYFIIMTIKFILFLADSEDSHHPCPVHSLEFQAKTTRRPNLRALSVLGLSRGISDWLTDWLTDWDSNFILIGSQEDCGPLAEPGLAGPLNGVDVNQACILILPWSEAKLTEILVFKHEIISRLRKLFVNTRPGWSRLEEVY